VVADASAAASAAVAPLLPTLILPLVIGLAIDAARPRLAAWMRPVVGKMASVALIVIGCSTRAARPARGPPPSSRGALAQRAR
jgi:predicted Na+-dependent transporter